MLIKYSVIIPMYNSEKWIEKCISSVVNQTYANFEIIVIDDGSKDNSTQIVQKIQTKDSRIKLFRKDNGGYCSAINYALDRLTNSSDYFMMLGSDDQLLNENFFKEATSLISSDYPDLIGFKTKIIDEFDNNHIDEATDGIKRYRYENQTTIDEFTSKYKKEATIFFQRDTSKLFKTSKLNDLKYYGKYGVDADGVFTMLFSEKCNSFALLPVYGYGWLVRTDSISNKGFSKRVNIDRLNVWKKFSSNKYLDKTHKKISKKMIARIRIMVFMSPILDLYFSLRTRRRNKKKKI